MLVSQCCPLLFSHFGGFRRRGSDNRLRITEATGNVHESASRFCSSLPTSTYTCLPGLDADVANNFIDTFSNIMSDPLVLYGLNAVPADQSKLSPATTSPKPVPISSVKPPTTPLASRINAYTHDELSPDTYRHSLRVYSLGVAIAQECFPSWKLEKGGKLDETWFCCAMLHDIGTTEKNMGSTRLSYEFWAGYLALDLLQGGGDESAKAQKDQAESVAEAIIRHQDVQDSGSITLLTALIHFGTLLDNIGAGSQYVHPETIDAIVKEYPRKGWCACFRGTVEQEKRLKPWAMVSRIEGFEGKIEENGRGGATGKYD